MVEVIARYWRHIGGSLDIGYWTFDYAHTYPIVTVIYFVPFVSFVCVMVFTGSFLFTR